MILKSYAKVNWHLQVLGKRPDGYHELDMLMQRIDLYDELSFQAADTLQLIISGSTLASDSSNLVLRAACALQEVCAISKGARITLDKHIPLGAGLGGGSADAATTLQGLNVLWGLHLSQERLQEIGLRLGADVPYCLEPGPARVGGLGERIMRLPAFPPYWLILRQPSKSLSTRDVFRHFDSQARPRSEAQFERVSDALSRADLQSLRRFARNDLQETASSLLPEIGPMIDDYYRVGADFAQMTGSGSVVFGAFRDGEAAASAYSRLEALGGFCHLCCTR
ncbi:MAG: 4-(cytidine 5'-diphospho)-2-C-methyl-D-erythritol kinase [Christensenellales bacterium]